jgi:hypothetical protein
MIDDYKLKFFNHPVAVAIVRNMRKKKEWVNALEYVNLFLSIFPESIDLLDEASLISYFLGNYFQSLEFSNALIELKPKENLDRYTNNKIFSIQQLNNVFDKIYKIPQLLYTPNSPFTLICENCSEKTISNFLSLCLDRKLFNSYIVIYDDEKSKLNLPSYFIQEKKKSNLIETIGKNLTPYIFYISKNWKFFEKKKYLSLMRNILDTKESYGQVFMNKKLDLSSNLENFDIHDKVEVCFTSTNDRYYEYKGNFSLKTCPTLFKRDVIMEYNYLKKYPENHLSGLLDGYYAIPV